jgi:hypothetical protein
VLLDQVPQRSPKDLGIICDQNLERCWHFVESCSFTLRFYLIESI